MAMSASPEPPRRDFDAAAATWDEESRRVKLSRDIAAAIRREVPLSREQSLLDYGAGTGLVTLELAPLVGRALAADSSPKMLEMLEHKVTARSMANVQTQPIDPDGDGALHGTFDVIISSMTLHHVREPAALLKRLRDRLADGGTLALADLDEEGGRFHADPTGVFHNGFGRAHIAQLFAEALLREVRVVDAATIERPHPDGRSQSFGVFLAARRPSPAAATVVVRT
jgi:SAM-dependent methyltransferase